MKAVKSLVLVLVSLAALLVGCVKENPPLDPSDVVEQQLAGSPAPSVPIRLDTW